MHIAILHNAVSPDDAEQDLDVLVQVEAIERALNELGHQPRRLACTLDLEAVRHWLVAGQSDMGPIDAVFNLVENLGGSDWLAHMVPSLLDVLGMPYSGAPSEGIILSAQKLLAKQRLVQAGLPTPPWLALPEDEPTGLDDISSACRLPPQTLCIVKPIKEHASVGLGDESVFRGGDRASLCEEIRRRSRRIGRVCFAEAYIEGREFNLGLLAGPAGPEVLPPAEIQFLGFPPEKPRIVGYRAKWDEGSFEYRNTPRSFDFEDHQGDLLDELRRLARTCWDVFGLRGYARVDFRVDAELRPWILEVNSNPCLSPDAGFAAALERASIPLAEAVRRILDDTAVKRC